MEGLIFCQSINKPSRILVMNNAEIFKDLITSAKTILITTHVSPDPDAIASVLLMNTTLKLNFPDKQITASSEDSPEGLDYLEGHDQLLIKPLNETISSLQPDVIIIVDAMNLSRCTRQPGAKMQPDSKLIIIDHHEKQQVQDATLYINNGSPAVAMDIYELLFDQLKLNMPPRAPETAMVGIYADSGGFIYPSVRQQAMFELVARLLQTGVNLELVAYRLNQFTKDHMAVITELCTNISGDSDFNYSFLSDEFINQWENTNKSSSALHRACGYFVNSFIRNIDSNQWGFIVYKDALEGPGMYSVSFRSINGIKDVSEIASKLDGGGHKAAAGARLKADNIKSAIANIQEVIF